MLPTDQWEKVKRILHTAMDLSADQRAAFIQNEAGGDERIYNEVLTLLQAHDEAGMFIASPVASVAQFVGADREDPIAGKQIGAYRILREIGRGGMGAVYLAERADSQFQKKVAVKLIKRGLDTDEIVGRFRNERQILASLEHPNIARLLDGGATEDGLPFLVMEYVEGTRLTDYCDEQALGVDQRLNLFLAVCSAVSHAHRNLVVHRDLKPSNVLVDLDGQPKLLDFGIAKLLTPSGDAATRRTRPDLNVMTPEYASPEQVRGENVTTQADVYSLGVILYELLSGSRPYELGSRSLDRIIDTICNFEPARPSSRAIQDDEHGRPANAVSRSIRGDLDNIVLMAIRKEPERRYTSVEQFAADIRRYRKGLPVIAREDTFGYRASKFVRRNRAGVAAGIGIGASLVGGLAMTTRQSRIARRQRDKAEKINRFLQRMLASADPRSTGKDARVAEVLKIAADSMRNDFAAQPEIVADLSSTIGMTFLSLGQVDDAEPHLREALDIRTELYGISHHDTAVSLNNFGRLSQAKGDLKGAEDFYRNSLDVMRHVRNLDPLDLASVLGNLGYLLMLEGQYEEALELHAEELDILRRKLGDDHPESARSLGNLGNIYAAIGHKETAERLHRHALEITRRHYRREHPDVAQALLHLAIPIQTAKPDEAESLCRESLEMRRRFFGDAHVETAWSRYHLGGVLLRKREFSSALSYADEILRHRGHSIPEMHSVINSTLLMQARAYVGLGRPDIAEHLCRECISLREKTLPPDHWLLDAARGHLGECLMQLGRTDKAIPLMRESYLALREKLGTDHEHTRSAKERLT